MKTILIKPLITEKMTTESEKVNVYGFVVNDKADKLEIKKAVEKQYGVTVAAVRTLRVDGKTRQRQSKSGTLRGRTTCYKKAIVRLAGSETIDFYGNV
jgi:large subunit ribosomal protein L23